MKIWMKKQLLMATMKKVMIIIIHITMTTVMIGVAPGACTPKCLPKGPTPLEKLKVTTEKKSEGKTIWTPELFECTVCNKQYTSERHLMKHVQKAHISLSA